MSARCSPYFYIPSVPIQRSYKYGTQSLFHMQLHKLQPAHMMLFMFQLQHLQACLQPIRISFGSSTVRSESSLELPGFQWSQVLRMISPESFANCAGICKRIRVCSPRMHDSPAALREDGNRGRPTLKATDNGGVCRHSRAGNNRTLLRC